MCRADGESGRATQTWWGSLIQNASDITSSLTGGIAGIISAQTGNYAPVAEHDNTPKVLAIAGVGALVLIVVLFIIFKK